MIHKVSSHTKAEWLGVEAGAEHQSINKMALTSFEEALVKTAEKLASLGKTSAQIASALGMTEEEMKLICTKYVEAHSQIAEGTTKVACACEPEVSAEDKALAAYQEMYGIKQASAMDENIRNGSTILTANGKCEISNIGGPKKQIGSQTANSIWDSEVLMRQSKEQDNGEKIKLAMTQEVARREAIKKESRNHTIDEETLKLAMQNDHSIANNSAPEAHKYSNKISSRGMSIFDNEFSRVPEKTTGEIAAMEKKASKEKDTATTAELLQDRNSSRSIFDSMISNMMKNAPKE